MKLLVGSINKSLIGTFLGYCEYQCSLMLIWKNSSIETAVMSTSVTPATGFASHKALRNVAQPRQPSCCCFCTIQLAQLSQKTSQFSWLLQPAAAAIKVLKMCARHPHIFYPPFPLLVSMTRRLVELLTINRQSCIITEKAPTRVFSWLKVATTIPLSHLRHY